MDDGVGRDPPPGRPPERPPRDGTFEPVALTDDRPHLGRWVLVVVIALLAVIAKPWDGGTGSGDGRAPGAGATSPLSPAPAAVSGSTTSLAASPTATPGATGGAGAEVAAFCLNPSAWLVASVESYRDRTVRVWRAIETASAASGPDDPAIPRSPVVSEGVRELGWCAPVVGDERPAGDATVDVWRLGQAGATPVTLLQDQPFAFTSAFGAMYAPPGSQPGRDTRVASWLAGRFVFRHRTDDGHERWFGVDVEIRPRLLDPGPSPEPATEP
jgi:hypothetical protein